MKRFTSILCALCVMLGAWAIPQEKVLRDEVANRHHNVTVAGLSKSDFKAGKAMKAPKAHKALKAAKHAPAALKENFTIEFEEPMTFNYYAYFGQWSLSASNDLYKWSCWLIDADDSSIAGSYTNDDFDSPTYLIDKTANKTIYPKTVEAEISEEDGRIDVAITMADSLGNTYDISMFYAEPTAEEQVDFESEDLKVTQGSSYGYPYYKLIVNDSTLGASLIYWDEIVSGDTIEYDGYDFDGYMIVDGKQVDVYSGYIVIEATEEGGYHVTGRLLAMNSVEYLIDWTYALPEPARDAALVADVEMLNYISEGEYFLYGYSADSSKYIVLGIKAKQVAGTYTLANLDLDYSYVGEFANGDTLWLTPLTANLVVAMDAVGTITCAGTMLMQNDDDDDDVVEYTIALTAQFEEEDTSIDGDAETDYAENFDTYTIDTQYLSYYGDIIVKASNDNGGYLGLDFYVTADSLVPGIYPVNDSETAPSVYAGSTDGSYVYYSFVAYLDAEGYLSEVWYLVDGTVTVNADGSIDINALNSKGHTVVCHLGASSGEEVAHIQYDEEDADFNVNFTEYTEYDDNLAQYGVIVIEAEDDNLNYITLYLTAQNTDTELVPGEYPVSSTWNDASWDAYTTIAGDYDASEGLYPSYAATLIQQDGKWYINNVWYIVGGKVTVNADYSIDVAAVNSYGKSVISHMTGRQTPVEEVKVESVATKRIENGTLLIERNGALYDAQGIRR